MFKWIYRHKQYQIALTVIAPDRDSADQEMKNLWTKASEMGIDFPPPDTFEAFQQIIL